MQVRPKNSRAGRARSGFTLIEVMVALAIVSTFIVGLVLSLNRSAMTQAQVRNMKVARELGLYTLGQIEAGLYWDEIDEQIIGTYADLGFPDFSFEAALGDEGFDSDIDETSDRYDPWADDESNDDDGDEEEEVEEAYEQVRIKVMFYKLSEYKNELELERWIPWEQVYGPDEEDAEGDGGSLPL